MSTYRSTFNTRKDTGPTGWTTRGAICVLLCGLIMLLLIQGILFLSPVASANKAIQQPEYLARAGVSVVRIVTVYGPPSTPGGGSIPLTPVASAVNPKSASTNSLDFPEKQCTGLGIIVASGTQNAWVLTDGSLVSNDGLTCTSIGPASIAGTAKVLSLNTIKVYLSSAYSDTSPTAVTGNIASVHCSNSKSCKDGVSLFSFHSNALLPIIKLSDSTNTSLPDTAAIQLNQSSLLIATPATTSSLQQYLTPTAKDATIGNVSTLDGLENGTSIVDQQGVVNEVYLKDSAQTKLFKATEVSAFLKNQGITSDQFTNDVASNWNNGIDEYYQGPSHYNNAKGFFTKAYNASGNQFQGAQKFVQLIASVQSKENTTPSSKTGEPSNNGMVLPYIGFVSYLLLAIIIIGGIVFLLLLILLNMIFKRGQRHKDFVEADKQATIQAQQIQEREAQQLPAQPAPSWSQPVVQQAAQYPAQQPVNGASNMPLASLLSAPASAQSKALADYPTVEMAEAKRNGMLDMEKTQPFVSDTQHEVRRRDQLGLAVITSTNPGIKRQYKPNEDSLFAIKGVRMNNGQPQQIGLFVVADGMGGHANGQDASRLAIQTIIDYILPRLLHEGMGNETPEKLLVDSVLQANQAVHQYNIENNADMGTTVTATLIIDTYAHVANVGDSRTYLYRTNEGLLKVTRDHSVVASLVDAGIIKPDDIYTHPKRNQIYRSLGEKPFVEVDPFTVPLQLGDTMLLCSDGLWDMVRDPEIKRVLEMPVIDLQQVGDNLIKAALEGGGEDNVSVIVIHVIEQTQQPLTPGLETIYLQENVKMPQLS